MKSVAAGAAIAVALIAVWAGSFVVQPVSMLLP